MLKKWKAQEVNGVGGEKCRVKYSTEIPLIIGNSFIRTEVVVSDQKDEDCILGNNVLKPLKVNIDLGKRELRFANECIPLDRCKRSIKLTSRCYIIKGQLQNNKAYTIEDSTNHPQHKRIREEIRQTWDALLKAKLHG